MIYCTVPFFICSTRVCKTQRIMPGKLEGDLVTSGKYADVEELSFQQQDRSSVIVISVSGSVLQLVTSG